MVINYKEIGQLSTSIFWTLRETLTKAGHRALFEMFDRELVSLATGDVQAIDRWSIVPAPKQRNTRAENQAIKKAACRMAASRGFAKRTGILRAPSRRPRPGRARTKPPMVD